MTQNIGIIIIEKTGNMKPLSVKEFKEEELYKKCGFKKPDHFSKQGEWTKKIDKIRYNISVFAKTEGKANTENKYDFPPPIDTTLFFGNCVVIASDVTDTASPKLISLTIPLWEKMYEKLFGGFEDLTNTVVDDELEVDELDAIPKEKKTKDGYMKDGFVVDSDVDTDNEGGSDSDDESSDEIEGSPDDVEDELEIEDIGSELSEDDYDTSSDDSEESS